MKWQPLFSTPTLRSWNWTLPGMIAGALFIHALAFYLVQAAGSAGNKRTSLSGRVTVLNPDKPRNQATLAWIENHDPAAFFQANAPEPPHLFDSPPYQPSYETALPVPLPIVSQPSETVHRSFFPPGAVPVSPNAAAATLAKIPPPSTKIRSSPSIDLDPAARFAPPIIAGDIPLPSRFLLVPAGPDRAKSLFLLQSSGNERLDRYAREWLEQAASVKNEQSSGWATIFWGDEIWQKHAP